MYTDAEASCLQECRSTDAKPVKYMGAGVLLLTSAYVPLEYPAIQPERGLEEPGTVTPSWSSL